MALRLRLRSQRTQAPKEVPRLVLVVALDGSMTPRMLAALLLATAAAEVALYSGTAIRSRCPGSLQQAVTALEDELNTKLYAPLREIEAQRSVRYRRIQREMGLPLRLPSTAQFIGNTSLAYMHGLLCVGRAVLEHGAVSVATACSILHTKASELVESFEGQEQREIQTQGAASSSSRSSATFDELAGFVQLPPVPDQDRLSAFIMERLPLIKVLHRAPRQAGAAPAIFVPNVARLSDADLPTHLERVSQLLEQKAAADAAGAPLAKEKLRVLKDALRSFASPCPARAAPTRMAVCIVGAARSFGSPLLLAALKHHLIDGLTSGRPQDVRLFLQLKTDVDGETTDNVTAPSSRHYHANSDYTVGNGELPTLKRSPNASREARATGTSRPHAQVLTDVLRATPWLRDTLGVAVMSQGYGIVKQHTCPPHEAKGEGLAASLDARVCTVASRRLEPTPTAMAARSPCAHAIGALGGITFQMAHNVGWCARAVGAHERATGEAFDVVAYARPDLVWWRALPSYCELDALNQVSVAHRDGSDLVWVAPRRNLDLLGDQTQTHLSCLGERCTRLPTDGLAARVCSCCGRPEGAHAPPAAWVPTPPDTLMHHGPLHAPPLMGPHPYATAPSQHRCAPPKVCCCICSM